MPDYFVTYDIDIDAESPTAAAEEALACILNPDRIGWVFLVTCGGARWRVELGDHDPVVTPLAPTP